MPRVRRSSVWITQSGLVKSNSKRSVIGWILLCQYQRRYCMKFEVIWNAEVVGLYSSVWARQIHFEKLNDSEEFVLTNQECF